MIIKIYPEYPTFVKDFLTSYSCKKMSMEEFGIFNWMLMHSWNYSEKPAHLPNDPEEIAWMIRIEKQLIINFLTKWKKWEETECGQYIYNPKLLSIYNDLLNRSQVYANNRLGKGKKQLKNNRKSIHKQAGNGNGNGNEDVIKDFSELRGGVGGKPETSELFDYWLSMPNLAKHKKYTPDMAAAETNALKTYELEDLKGAVKNLNDILADPSDYLGVIAWTFEDFFRKGSPQKASPFKKLLNENNPVESLKRIKPKSEWI